MGSKNSKVNSLNSFGISFGCLSGSEQSNSNPPPKTKPQERKSNPLAVNSKTVPDDNIPDTENLKPKTINQCFGTLYDFLRLLELKAKPKYELIPVVHVVNLKEGYSNFEACHLFQNHFNDEILSKYGNFNSFVRYSMMDGRILSKTNELNLDKIDSEVLPLVCDSLKEDASQLEAEELKQADDIIKQITKATLKVTDLKDKSKAFFQALLKAYTKETYLYGRINKLLRDENWTEMRTIIPFLYYLSCSFVSKKFNPDSSLKKLYRGTKMPMGLLFSYINEKNRYFSWNGFTSTSKNPAVAQNFGIAGQDECVVVFTIDCEGSAPSQLADVSKFSPFAEEEVIVAPTSIFERLGANKNGNTYNISLKLIEYNQILSNGKALKTISPSFIGLEKLRITIKTEEPELVLTGIEKKGESTLASLLTGNKSLRKLKILNLNLTDDGILNFIMAINTTNIESLSCFTSLPSKTFSMLLSGSRLRTLEIGKGCNFSNNEYCEFVSTLGMLPVENLLLSGIALKELKNMNNVLANLLEEIPKTEVEIKVELKNTNNILVKLFEEIPKTKVKRLCLSIFYFNQETLKLLDRALIASRVEYLGLNGITFGEGSFYLPALQYSKVKKLDFTDNVFEIDIFQNNIAESLVSSIPKIERLIIQQPTLHHDVAILFNQLRDLNLQSLYITNEAFGLPDDSKEQDSLELDGEEIQEAFFRLCRGLKYSSVHTLNIKIEYFDYIGYLDFTDINISTLILDLHIWQDLNSVYRFIKSVSKSNIKSLHLKVDEATDVAFNDFLIGTLVEHLPRQLKFVGYTKCDNEVEKKLQAAMAKNGGTCFLYPKVWTYFDLFEVLFPRKSITDNFLSIPHNSKDVIINELSITEEEASTLGLFLSKFERRSLYLDCHVDNENKLRLILEGMELLERLVLQNNFISNAESLEILMMFLVRLKTKSLVLQGNRINEKGFQVLLNKLSQTALEDLVINENISWPMYEKLFQILPQTNLLSLKLINLICSGQNLTISSQVFPSPGLKRLDLEFWQLDVSSLCMWLLSSKLEYLAIHSHVCKKQDIIMILKALPQTIKDLGFDGNLTAENEKVDYTEKEVKLCDVVLETLRLGHLQTFSIHPRLLSPEDANIIGEEMAKLEIEEFNWNQDSNKMESQNLIKDWGSLFGKSITDPEIQAILDSQKVQEMTKLKIEELNWNQDPNKMESQNLLKDWHSLFGKSIADPEIQAVLDSQKPQKFETTFNPPHFYHFSWTLGLSLIFRDSIFDSALLYGRFDEKFKKFEGALPYHITFDMNIFDLISFLGKPNETTTRGTEPITLMYKRLGIGFKFLSPVWDLVNNKIWIIFLFPKKSNPENTICALCAKPVSGLSFCRQCRLVPYCTRTCQSTHWEVHKTHCNKYFKNEDALRPEAGKA